MSLIESVSGALKDAGWYPGRAVPFDACLFNQVVELHANGLQSGFLSSFWDLRIAILPATGNESRLQSLLYMEPNQPMFVSEDVISKLSDLFCEQSIPFAGSSWLEYFFLGRSGTVYSIDANWEQMRRISPDPYAAMNAIISGDFVKIPIAAIPSTEIPEEYR